MNVVLEEISPCKKRLKVEVPADRVNTELDKITKDFQKQAKIPGFRPGKAPKAMIEKRFEKEIENEFKRSFVSQAFREAVESKKLKVVTSPQIEDLYFQRGMSLSFSTVVDLMPEFPVPDYKSIKIEKSEMKPVTDAEVNEVVDNMTQRFADYKTIENRETVQDGDFAVMDYTASMEGKPLTDAEPDSAGLSERKNFWLLVKKDGFLPGFVEQLKSMKVGETKDMTIKFPEDFGYENLKGKTAIYNVTLKEIKEQVLPELNDEFAQNHFQMPLEDLKQRIREDLESRQKQEAERNHIRQMLEQLQKMVDFELPESLVQLETQRLINDIVHENEHRGIPQNVIEENKEQIFKSAGENAREHVKVSILLEKVAEAEKLEVTEQELNLEIHLLAHRTQNKPEKLAKEIVQSGRLSELEEQILQRKTVQHLLKLLIGEDKPVQKEEGHF